jgi:hypothetical protein
VNGVIEASWSAADSSLGPRSPLKSLAGRHRRKRKLTTPLDGHVDPARPCIALTDADRDATIVVMRIAG